MPRRPSKGAINAALGFYETFAQDAQPQPVQPQTPEAEPFTWSETWRHECEARFVKAMDAERRKRYLEGVAQHRGEEAARSLEIDSRAKVVIRTPEKS